MRLRLTFAGVLGLVAAFVAGGCGDDGSSAPGGHPEPETGALVSVVATSQVGVLLDEIPERIRDRVAAELVARDSSFWVARAKRQLALATYRLNFRAGFYDEDSGKQQLPLPPEPLLAIALWPNEDASLARRATVEGHDYVLADYTLVSTLLTDVDSPGLSEPALAAVGGSWDEPFVFPVDPELLVQRTGYACMDEAEFPPYSVDSEDTEFFYDQECGVEDERTPDGCHYTELPSEACTDALSARVGSVSTAIHFERLAWDAKTAEAWRFGAVTNPDGADLAVVSDELGVNRLTYRYIAPDSCALAESCVGGSGWRRLLQFNASEQNLGAKPVDIGNVDYFVDNPDVSTPNANHHVYEYSSCHHHYHFSHYATFTYGGDPTLGSKRAFCLESVARYSNNEQSPTWSPYSDCSYQGISQGWGDQYNAGIECQWVDVTSIDTASGAVTEPLGFRSNPDGFLCEGEPVLDAKGNPVWEPTPFLTSDQLPVDRPKCDFMPDWDVNNLGTLDVTLPPPGEGMITSPCTRGQIGRRRNCGFNYDGAVLTCTPGKITKLRCSIPDGVEPQVVRLCEASAVLAAGVACTDADALASSDIEAGGRVSLVFTCPSARDAAEPGGLYAVYGGAVFPDDPASGVTCEAE